MMLKLLSQIVPKTHKHEGSEQIRQLLHTADLQVRHPEREVVEKYMALLSPQIKLDW